MATKKSSSKTAAKKKPAKPAKKHPKTTCGRFYLVPNGDGTATEVPVPNING